MDEDTDLSYESLTSHITKGKLRSLRVTDPELWEELTLTTEARIQREQKVLDAILDPVENDLDNEDAAYEDDTSLQTEQLVEAILSNEEHPIEEVLLAIEQPQKMEQPTIDKEDGTYNWYGALEDLDSEVQFPEPIQRGKGKRPLKRPSRFYDKDFMYNGDLVEEAVEDRPLKKKKQKAERRKEDGARQT